MYQTDPILIIGMGPLGSATAVRLVKEGANVVPTFKNYQHFRDAGHQIMQIVDGEPVQIVDVKRAGTVLETIRTFSRLGGILYAVETAPAGGFAQGMPEANVKLSTLELQKEHDLHITGVANIHAALTAEGMLCPGFKLVVAGSNLVYQAATGGLPDWLHVPAYIVERTAQVALLNELAHASGYEGVGIHLVRLSDLAETPLTPANAVDLIAQLFLEQGIPDHPAILTL